jgi:hypothetical protein
LGMFSISPSGEASIRMNPVKTRSIRETNSKSCRIETLFHECIHAFLGLNACINRVCPTFHELIGEEGHGRAFSLIHTKVHQIWKDLTGFELVDSVQSRWESVCQHLSYYQKQPTMCDLKTYGF